MRATLDLGGDSDRLPKDARRVGGVRINAHTRLTTARASPKHKPRRDKASRRACVASICGRTCSRVDELLDLLTAFGEVPLRRVALQVPDDPIEELVGYDIHVLGATERRPVVQTKVRGGGDE